MFKVLQDLQLKNAYVLHSLGLPKHQSKIYGEVDFVIVCDRGVACLEIKGGRVACVNGNWIFTDRYGIEHEKNEGPFAQVIGNMFSLRDSLKQHFCKNPHIKNMLVASGVVFPDIAFYNESQEIIPEIVYDSTTENISDYVNAVFDYWQGRAHVTPSKLPPALIKEIADYLRGEFSFSPALSDRLNETERHLVRLTAQQAQVMEALIDNLHLMIEGNAGTGKTLLALDYARKQSKQGKRVLYLTYNKNLANFLQMQLDDHERDILTIINLHALFGQYIKVDVEYMQKNVQYYFGSVLPGLFYEYLNQLSTEQIQAIQYDVIVLDEGQDIIKPDYLYSLDLLLKGGLEKGRWAVFYDDKQNIYNPEYENGIELLQSYQSAKFKLFVNCRNTVQIGTFGSRVSGVPMNEFIHENGEEVCCITYQDSDEFSVKLHQLLSQLKTEKIDLRDVVFLSPKKYSNSIVHESGIAIDELKEGGIGRKNVPQFATIQGFKGLDAKIVIMVDVERIRDEAYAQYMYIATTRARALLYIIVSDEFWRSHNAK
ncbi:MAG TPA: hypothetical protein DGZ34_09285 [Lachnospiraceae bacterium]|nr:hypothetical protein [Lachnospiraceae bacterium]